MVVILTGKTVPGLVKTGEEGQCRSKQVRSGFTQVMHCPNMDRKYAVLFCRGEVTRDRSGTGEMKFSGRI